MKLIKTLFISITIIVIIYLLFYWFQYSSKAYPPKANIEIKTNKVVGKIPDNWKELAQGGEEPGVRMLENVVPQVLALNPRYIRLDHIYDFYHVVKRESDGNLSFKWDELDATVCDIYHSGAKPFFSLGYMPPDISKDGSLISPPKDWNEWALIVQKTIERYSGKSTLLCNTITGSWMTDIYYEVWNEPDLETFGKWSIYGGEKDYKMLYYYSETGARNSQNVNYFHLGGPAITSLYQTWMLRLLDYIDENKLRIDFLSWHHYTTNPDDYSQDVVNLDSWLSSSEKYKRFRTIPKMITEWGYDSNPNPISETNVSAAHTIMSIRNLIDQNLNMAFAFEIKDGDSPRWGILAHNGMKKPRYNALKFLNNLDGFRLQVTGEGQYVRAIASRNGNNISLILVNYDNANSHTESVPVTFAGLYPGTYTLVKEYLSGESFPAETINTKEVEIKKEVLMPANSIVLLKLTKLE
jgi:hypothetical protein